uniref:G_PROTEIN_RECEP_F1_2 domain-containing protein n=1 Tax=Steinernema glaseri TaxID=37863 RepID=A0A1I7YNP4_9BILA
MRSILLFRNRSLLYCVGLLFISVQAVLGNAYSAYVIVYQSTHVPTALLDAAFGILQFFSLGTMVLLMLFYIVVSQPSHSLSNSPQSIIAVAQYTKDRARRGASIRRHRRQLLSVVIYATTPNVLLFPSIIAGVCNIVLSTMDLEQKIESNGWVQLSGVVNSINRVCIYIRLPVITLSTFVAFAPYRVILYQIPLPCWKAMFVKVHVIGTSDSNK